MSRPLIGRFLGKFFDFAQTLGEYTLLVRVPACEKAGPVNLEKVELAEGLEPPTL